MGDFGIFGSFGLERPYAEEDSKTQDGHNEKRFWSYLWVLGSVSDPQELTYQFLGEQNSVYASNGKTSFLILAF